MILDIDLTNGDLNTNTGVFQPTQVGSGNLNPVDSKKVISDIPKKKSNWPRILLFALVGIALGSIGYFVYEGSRISKELGFKFNIGEVVSIEKPELKRIPLECILMFFSLELIVEKATISQIQTQ